MKLLIPFILLHILLCSLSDAYLDQCPDEYKCIRNSDKRLPSHDDLLVQKIEPVSIEVNICIN